MANTATAYLANPYDSDCSVRDAAWTVNTDGGLPDSSAGHYSRFLFHNQFQGGNCGLLRLTGETGTVTLRATTSLNEADGQNCYDSDLQFSVDLTIVVSPDQPAGSVAMGTVCDCV